MEINRRKTKRSTLIFTTMIGVLNLNVIALLTERAVDEGIYRQKKKREILN